MRIAILHNALREDSAPDEIDVMAQVKTISESLVRLGHDIFVLPCDLDLAQVKRKLLSFSPDLSFNLVESLDGKGRLISVIPSLLDTMGIPYSGSPSESVHVTSNKIMAKQKMRAAGLPTSDWVGPHPEDVHSQSNDAHPLFADQKTWIVKSVWEHASLGIDGSGLIRNAGLESILSCLKDRAPVLGGMCFAEQYIDGREFNISIITGENGPRVLPPAEIIFQGYDGEKPKIVCYNAKWNEDSYEYTHTPRRFDFPSEDKPLLQFLEALTVGCWHLFQLRGYARVDFRVDQEGNPWILEVNANPCLSPDAGFFAALDQADIPFEKAVNRIIEDALREAPWKASLSSSTASSLESFDHRTGPLDFQFRYDPQTEDIETIRTIIQQTGFFHDYEVVVAVELIEERLQKGMASGYEFVFLESHGNVLGYACYGLIPCTKNSYDLYWIAVDPGYQKKGLGKIIITETETQIRNRGGKRIYIDTSDSSKYKQTFSFYKNNGYKLVSSLEDFYAEGDGKAVFVKVVE